LKNHIALNLLNERLDLIGGIVLKGILLELSCTPKPGLVDRLNSGANRDMDFNTFIQSTSALTYGFYQLVQLGLNYSDRIESILFEFRKIGKNMEKKMFESTGGINTQKGLIFLEGLVCIAAGSLDNEKLPFSAEKICCRIQSICKGIVNRELVSLHKNIKKNNLSNGEKLFLKYGITGIRGEVEKGLPTVRKMGLPALREGLKNGLNFNDASVQSLIHIMSIAEDTNVLSRSSMDFLKLNVQKKAREIIRCGGMYTAEGRKNIHDLDEYFIQKGINPGGSADLLAITITLFFLSLMSASENS